jgi:hypothetical protein
MNKYIVHNMGELIRDRKGYGSAEREPATVQEFDDFEAMHPFDRAQFIWMLEHCEIVISMGETVYQIRKSVG